MENGWKRLVIALLIAILATDLLFYFVIYASGLQGNLDLPFPPFPH
jgi:hypothetical protein